MTPRRWVPAALAVPPVMFLGCVALVLGGGAGGQGGPPSAEAVADIPAEFLALYERAAGTYGLDWAVLAGIGKVECDHGRSQLAGCNPPGTINGAGARGPMQFLGSTWRAGADTFALEVAGPPTAPGQEGQGYATDGDGDGLADPWIPADAIVAAARLLSANGAPADYPGALWAYNHSPSYRATVLGWADAYRNAGAAGGPPSAVTGGPVSLSTVGGITVNSAIVPQVQQLLATAAGDGVALRGSGYRDPGQQIALRRAHCGASNFAIYQMPASQCSPPTARPGTSMHERGLAIDFTACSSGSACFVWLSAHAATYGLFNLPGEPWHWSIDGT